MEDLQTTKLQLEVDKLNADIYKLNTPAWRSSDFWKSVLPPFLSTLAVLATLYITFGKSVMDDEKRKLELQKEQLKLEVMQFEGTKKDIQKEIAGSTIDKETLQKQIRSLRTEKSNLASNVKVLSSQSRILRDENANIKSASLKDKGFYQNELKKTYALESGYLKQLSALENTSNQKDIQIAKTGAELKYYKSKTKLSAEQVAELRTVLLSADAGAHEKLAVKYSNEAKKLEKEYDKFSQETETMTAEQLQRFFELYFLKSEATKK